MRPFDQLMNLFSKHAPKEPGIIAPGVDGKPIPDETNRGGPSGGGAHKASRPARQTSGQHRAPRW